MCKEAIEIYNTVLMITVDPKSFSLEDLHEAGIEKYNLRVAEIDKVLSEKADTIAALRARAEKAEAALEKIVELNEGWHGKKDCDCHTCKTLRIAEEALAGKEERNVRNG